MHDCKKVKDRQHLFGFLLLFSLISTSLFYAAAIYLSLNQYIHIYIMQSVYYILCITWQLVFMYLVEVKE